MALPDLCAALGALERDHARRRLRPLEQSGPVLRLGGRELVNFSSNDYLDLAREPEVVEGARRALERWGAGAGSSRLITGNTTLTEELEAELAAWKGCEAALVFSSGYLANLALLGAFAGPGTPVFADRLAHASLIDGMLLSKAPWSRFRHNDVSHLAEQLASRKTTGALIATESVFSMEGDLAPLPQLASRKTTGALIATESVFSMEGDLAPLPQLASLAAASGAWLLVDEAHATGVFGEAGEGLTPGLPVGRENLLAMGTFGKALGNSGAYFCGTRVQRDWLVNTARSFIFTTALPPSVLGGTLAAVRYLRKHPGLGRALLDRSAALKTSLERRGVPMVPSASQILSVFCGANEKALSLAAHLEAKGYLAVAIRPPTVEPGKARVRLSLTRGITEEQAVGLVDAVASFPF
ncbi:MAG: 8-amino-7-oxononanoate synthase [Spirochaetes bacterium]|nr:8-amino-7-oxononanoate synthase [Spirochaetota bacterium]